MGSAGCSFQDFEEIFGSVEDAPAPPAGTAIPFEEFSDNVGTVGSVEVRALIRTAQGYQALFGHPAPASVDFSKQWVIYYNAGAKLTGGFDANISSLTRTSATLAAATALVSAGSGCAVTQGSSVPFVLIKFAAQPGAVVDFTRHDSVLDCPPITNICATVLCAPGSHCEGQNVQCVRAPCPPIAVCVPDTDPCAAVTCMVGNHCVPVAPPCAPQATQCPLTGACVPNDPVVRCGGFGGFPYPGRGTCVDDPSDGCDPNAGGADCGGICSCVQNVVCAAGASFDSSPSVCSCVPLVAPPPPAMCGPVCDIFCQFGHQLDPAGCPLCQCKSAP